MGQILTRFWLYPESKRFENLERKDIRPNASYRMAAAMRFYIEARMRQ